MSDSNAIMGWYRRLSSVSQDDQADFEVMLLDKQHPDDAFMAIRGMVTNLLERGWNESIIQLMLSATRRDVVSPIRLFAIGCVEFALVIHDRYFRHCTELQEVLLDHLCDDEDELFYSVLRSIQHARQHIVTIGAPLDIESSLIYHLIVVGKERIEHFN